MFSDGSRVQLETELTVQAVTLPTSSPKVPHSFLSRVTNFTWLKFFVDFLGPFRKSRDCVLKYARTLSFIFYAILTTVAISFNARWSQLQTVSLNRYRHRRTFWVITFLRRFCQTYLQLGHMISTFLDLETIIIFTEEGNKPSDRTPNGRSVFKQITKIIKNKFEP
jgi:hypothetical protein